MKKTILRYGSYGIITILVFLGVNLFIHGNSIEIDFATQEVIGYVGIFLGNIFVFFGLKYYRDNVNNGKLGFGEGLKLGLGIILLPAFAFALFDVLYVVLFNPEFFNTYYNAQVEQMRKALPEADFKAKLQAMESEKELFSNPGIQFVVMFLTVFLIGIVMTVVSSLILKRPKTSLAEPVIHHA